MQGTTLTGKNALVTGGSRGIVAAIAKELARKGAAGVAITYLGSKGKADEVAAEIVRLGARAAVIQADILDEDFGPKVVQQVLEGLGTSTLDVVVNNAALADLKAQQPFQAITPNTFKDVFVGNVYSPLCTTRAALPHLPASGGRIINISSIASREPNFDPVMTYGASKTALDSFTRSLASMYAAEKKATFNSVSVGPTSGMTPGIYSPDLLKMSSIPWHAKCSATRPILAVLLNV